jgi:hypothetical protein
MDRLGRFLFSLCRRWYQPLIVKHLKYLTEGLLRRCQAVVPNDIEDLADLVVFFER